MRRIGRWQGLLTGNGILSKPASVWPRTLKSGRPFADPATVLTEGDQLRKRVAQLRLEVERLLAGVQALRQHETYRTLAGIADWERYFVEARQRLAEDIERLRSQLDE